ncbi:hypothetical protein PsYK624_060780 [Phanerochaete sordida]|uniref:F-box domain-containing protein n=1 Tax=Phanerochaete sordida TaxID=48140 RepID=A0A9P3G7Y5_9APHY|nr:hypothetical protein PsYK624_060780 [Phanerochaete sordida]
MPPTISPIPGEADILSEGQSSTARDDLFPPELVDMFLGYAVDDKDLPTLKAASLVCRSWWALSCPYIFRRVVVISESSLEGLAGFLEPDQGAHRYISTLAIHPRPTEPFGPAHWVDDVPAKLAAMGPRLRVLELVQLNEHDTHLGAGFVRGLAGFAAVDSLTLHECSMTPPLLRALLSAPPALRTVTVRSLITTQVGTGAVLPCLRSPALRSLEVRPTAGYTSSAENILPWIATTATAQSLRALRLTVRISESVGVGQFVLAVGERLEELELELEPFLDLPLETAGESLVAQDTLDTGLTKLQ